MILLLAYLSILVQNDSLLSYAVWGAPVEQAGCPPALETVPVQVQERRGLILNLTS